MSRGLFWAERLLHGAETLILKNTSNKKSVDYKISYYLQFRRLVRESNQLFYNSIISGLWLDPRAAELAAGRKKCGLAAGKIAASRQPGRKKMRLSRRQISC